MNLNRDDKVLIRFKRGFKLAMIVGRHSEGYSLRVWNATGRVWTRPTFRPEKDIYGRANEQDMETYYYTRSHPSEAA
jgi:hypothetical protein